MVVPHFFVCTFFSIFIETINFSYDIKNGEQVKKYVGYYALMNGGNLCTYMGGICVPLGGICVPIWGGFVYLYGGNLCTIKVSSRCCHCFTEIRKVSLKYIKYYSSGNFTTFLYFQ